MSGLTVTRGYVYSSLGTDPDLNALVELFVSEIPNRIAKLEAAWLAQDWQTLGKSVHQFKGAVGSYGFDDLTPSLERLDQLLQSECPKHEVGEALAKVMELCSQARAGAPR